MLGFIADRLHSVVFTPRDGKPSSLMQNGPSLRRKPESRFLEQKTKEFSTPYLPFVYGSLSTVGVALQAV